MSTSIEPAGFGRRLAAILYADIVGYGRMIELDEAATVTAVSHLMSEVIKPAIEAHNGRLIRTMGDGLLAEFPNPLDALGSAIAMQRQAMAQALAQRHDRQIKLRIGLSIGDIYVDGAEIHGKSVNIAARLEQIADVRTIWLTRAVYEHVQRQVELPFRYEGMKRLKNVENPIEVYSLDVGTVDEAPSRFIIPNDEAASLSRPSIAVLPLVCHSDTGDIGYVGEAIADGLSCGLCRFRDLMVIAHNASGVRIDTFTPNQIGERLGVRYIIGGTVIKIGQRLRVSVKLLDVANGTYLWANQYDQSFDDLFDIHDDIIDLVVGALPIKLTELEQSRLRTMHTTNLDAYGLVSRSLELIETHDRKANDTALELLERAERADPNYAGIFAARARAENFQFRHSWNSSPAQALQRAFDFAAHAVKLAPNDPRMLLELGYVRLFMKDIDGAIELYQRASELNPLDAEIYAHTASALVYQGNPERALEQLRAAARVNPAGSERYYWYSCEALFSLRDYEGVIRASRSMRDTSEIDRLLAASFAKLGRLDEARMHAERTLSKHPNFQVLPWADKQPETKEEMEHLMSGLLEAGLPE